MPEEKNHSFIFRIKKLTIQVILTINVDIHKQGQERVVFCHLKPEYFRTLFNYNSSLFANENEHINTGPHHESVLIFQ